MDLLQFKAEFLFPSSARDSWSYGPDQKAVVSSGGKVTWVPHINMKSFCQIDLTTFPYDTQVCSLKFGSWVYPGNQVSGICLIYTYIYK